MSWDDQRLAALARQVGEALVQHRLRVATAESCTGGWVAKALTDVVGSSGFMECGFVTYSNASKVALLAVAEGTLERFGAVSEATVREMAEGALARGGAELSVAISGIAGPGGGSAEKPVGTVWFAWSRLPSDGSGALATACSVRRFAGDREAVRRQAVAEALEGLLRRATAP